MVFQKTFLKTLPKLELHAHLNGSLSVNTLQKLRELSASDDIDTKMWPSNVSLDNLASCFELFPIAHNLTQTPEAIKIATLLTIGEFSEDNVIYLELRSTPRNTKYMSKKEYLQAMVDGISEAKNKFPSILTTILVSINRSESLENAEENVQLALEFSKKYPEVVVGMDLSGDPSKKTFKDFQKFLSVAREGGLKFSLHCAEIKNDVEVLEILEFGPERLGHFTLPPENLSYNLDNFLIELCVTSNIKCGTVPSVMEHHFRKYFGKHPVLLATDDKGVFNTTLTEEYSLVHEELKIPFSSFWDMNFKAVDFCFADTQVKEKLRGELNAWKEKNILDLEMK